MDKTKNPYPAANPKATPLRKLGTGVDGLDEVLHGGYPDGRTTMVKGGPGAGKSLFALQFLIQNAIKGVPGIFVTFEESVEAVRINAATLGWDVPALEVKGLLFIYHAKLDAAAVTAGPFSLKAIMAILDGTSRAMGATVVVIDAIDILMRRFEDTARARAELNALHEWLDAQRITALLTVKASDDADMAPRVSFLDYMADCVLKLDHRVSDQISTRRLRVLKYRGSAFGSNEYPYVISANGISLVPIGSAHLAHRPLGPYLSSGNAELDVALSGGHRKSACVLIAGPSGSGKTTVACTFVLAACARGDKVLFISFEESPEALESALRSAGIDLEPAVRSNKLRLLCRLPESAGSDEHLFQHLEIIKTFQPEIVVVDAISACSRMGSGKAAFDYCMGLVNACKERGITCFLTNQVRGSDSGEDLSGMGFSSLVDSVIELRFELSGDTLERSLLIRKARGCDHSPHVHDLSITDRGIVLARRGPAGDALPARPARETKAMKAAR